jgi:hypothetical protein
LTQRLHLKFCPFFLLEEKLHRDVIVHSTVPPLLLCYAELPHLRIVALFLAELMTNQCTGLKTVEIDRVSARLKTNML